MKPAFALISTQSFLASLFLFVTYHFLIHLKQNRGPKNKTYRNNENMLIVRNNLQTMLFIYNCELTMMKNNGNNF